MPWSIEKRGARYCVIKDDDGSSAGCHDTRAKAKRQLAALNAQEDNMGTDLPRLLGYFALAETPEGEPPRSFMQVMVAGKFKHPRYGDFEITEADLAGFAADIAERGARIQVDLDHDSALEGRSSRAAGWFTGKTRIATGPAQLWAEVEWTPFGAAAVTSKEYRYVSPEFGKRWRDASGKLVKGFRLFAAALTNRPFLPDMAAVTLSELPLDTLRRGSGLLPADVREALAAKLGVADDLDILRLAEWSTAFINDLPNGSFLHIKPGGSKDSEGKTTPRSLRMFPYKDASGKVDLPHLRNAIARIPQAGIPSDLKTRLQTKARRILENSGGTAASIEGDDMNMTDIAQALGLAEDADEEAILAAVKEQSEKATKADELEQEVQTLKARPDLKDEDVKTLVQQAAEGASAAKQLREMQMDTLLAEAVREGKILPAQKDAYRAMCAADFDGVKALLEATPEHSFKFEEQGSGEGGKEEQAVTPALRAAYTAKIDGTEYRPDDEGLRLDAKAREILGENTNPSNEQLIAAYEQAERELAS